MKPKAPSKKTIKPKEATGKVKEASPKQWERYSYSDFPDQLLKITRELDSEYKKLAEAIKKLQK